MTQAEPTVLSDGSEVTVRPIRPDDAPSLRALFHRLSTESRYQRFFGGITDLSPAMLKYLSDVDGDEHIALVAVRPGGDGEQLVGVARCVRARRAKDVAEAAFTVVDEVQRKGLGRALLAALSTAARARGVRRFVLEVKSSNLAMRGLITAAGGVLVDGEAGELTYEITLRHSPARILFDLILNQTKRWFGLFGAGPRPAPKLPAARL